MTWVEGFIQITAIGGSDPRPDRSDSVPIYARFVTWVEGFIQITAIGGSDPRPDRSDSVPISMQDL